MAKPLDERVKQILSKLEFNPKECLWDCHGTWVMYHRFIEIAGAKNKIRYELQEIETNSKEGIVCIKCVASIGVNGSEEKVITYGEASPKNNKNSYPYAMAEKRAVDRAILKLLGMHGFVYSEDEMDLSSNARPSDNVGASDDIKLETFQGEINSSKNLKELKAYGQMYKVHMGKAKQTSPAVYLQTKTLYETRLNELINGKESNV
jgi:hypothetical protein